MNPSSILIAQKPKTAKEIESLVNTADMFKLKTSDTNKNEDIKVWCDFQADRLQREGLRNGKKWQTVVQADPNYP